MCEMIGVILAQVPVWEIKVSHWDQEPGEGSEAGLGE